MIPWISRASKHRENISHPCFTAVWPRPFSNGPRIWCWCYRSPSMCSRQAYWRFKSLCNRHQPSQTWIRNEARLRWCGLLLAFSLDTIGNPKIQWRFCQRFYQRYLKKFRLWHRWTNQEIKRRRNRSTRGIQRKRWLRCRFWMYGSGESHSNVHFHSNNWWSGDAYRNGYTRCPPSTFISGSPRSRHSRFIPLR